MTSLSGSPARPRRRASQPSYPRKIALGVALAALTATASACGTAPTPYAERPVAPPDDSAPTAAPQTPAPPAKAQDPTAAGLPEPIPGEDVDVRSDGTCWSLDRHACQADTPCDPPIVRVRCPDGSEDRPMDDPQVQATGS